MRCSLALGLAVLAVTSSCLGARGVGTGRDVGQGNVVEIGTVPGAHIHVRGPARVEVGDEGRLLKLQKGLALVEAESLEQPLTVVIGSVVFTIRSASTMVIAARSLDAFKVMVARGVVELVVDGSAALLAAGTKFVRKGSKLLTGPLAADGIERLASVVGTYFFDGRKLGTRLGGTAPASGASLSTHVNRRAAGGGGTMASLPSILRLWLAVSLLFVLTLSMANGATAAGRRISAGLTGIFEAALPSFEAFGPHCQVCGGPRYERTVLSIPVTTRLDGYRDRLLDPQRRDEHRLIWQRLQGEVRRELILGKTENTVDMVAGSCQRCRRTVTSIRVGQRLIASCNLG